MNRRLVSVVALIVAILSLLGSPYPLLTLAVVLLAIANLL